MTDELTFLRLLRDHMVLARSKIDQLIPEISINEPLLQVSAILGSDLHQLNVRMAILEVAPAHPSRIRLVHGHGVSDPEGAADWLEAHMHTLYEVLLMSDYFVSGVIWDGPPHTISWHIATAAAGGSVVAKMACEALTLLSANHCANALVNE